MKKYQLGEFEEIVILTIAILHNRAYGVSIKNEIESRLARTVSMGAMHTALVRLEEKGYLESRLDGATNERGGRRKLLFRVTKSGQKALANARDMRNDLWRSIPKAAFNYQL